MTSENGILPLGKHRRVSAPILIGGGSGGVLAALIMLLVPRVAGSTPPPDTMTRAEVHTEVQEAKSDFDKTLGLTVKALEERMKGVERALDDCAHEQRESSRRLNALLERIPGAPK